VIFGRPCVSATVPGDAQDGAQPLCCKVGQGDIRAENCPARCRSAFTRFRRLPVEPVAPASRHATNPSNSPTSTAPARAGPQSTTHLAPRSNCHGPARAPCLHASRPGFSRRRGFRRPCNEERPHARFVKGEPNKEKSHQTDTPELTNGSVGRDGASSPQVRACYQGVGHDFGSPHGASTDHSLNRCS